MNLYLIVTLCPRDLLAVLKNLCAWPPPLSAAAAVAAVVAAQVEVGQRVEADIVRQVKAGKIEPPFSHSKRSWSCGEPKLFSARKFRSERPPTFFGSKLQPVFFCFGFERSSKCSNDKKLIGLRLNNFFRGKILLVEI